MWARIDTDCVIKASSSFWETMLAMRLDPALPPEECTVGAGHIMGSVSLSGQWKGKIEVHLAEGLAYHATAAMMMQPLETVAVADALDATKEIANMIAGVMKSSLPSPCAMTVPESRVEPHSFLDQPQTENTLAVGFRHVSGDLMVRVWEQECLQ